EETARELQNLAEVQALAAVALVNRPVAEVGDGDASARSLQCERRAGGGCDAAADDPERADQTIVERVHVHRAGAPAVDAGLPSEHLVEQLLRIDTERECVAVPAVGRRDAVAVLEQA